MIYTVIIVDDEEIVREGIRKKVKWHEFGFECIGTCENGRDAKIMIDQLNPNIVLSDIYMPYVDGLELAEYIYENYPLIKTVIFTGYDDFKYIQKALQLKVIDYILKPITSKEIENLLIKLRKELEQSLNKIQELKRLELLIGENKPEIKNKILNQLVNGKLNSIEIEKKLSVCDIHFSLNWYLVAIIDIDENNLSNNYNEDLLYFCVKNISEELVLSKKMGVVFLNHKEETIIIFNSQDLEIDAFYLLKEIMCFIYMNFDFTVTIGLSNICYSLVDLDIAYKQAENALEQRFLMGNNKILRANDALRKTNKIVEIKQYDDELLLAIKMNEQVKIKDSIINLFIQINNNDIDIDSTKVYINKLVFFIWQSMYDLKIDISEILGIEGEITTLVYKYKTLEQLKDWFEGMCIKLADHLSKSRESYSKKLIHMAKQYIKDNFANSSISINKVCKHINISSSYFSTIFKNETKLTFIDYLTQIRMEKAKNLLLSTNLKSYEIAEKVGYSDPHYFSIAFKKYTGLNPTNFREMV